MRVLHWCAIFLLWAIVSTAHGATTEDTEIQSGPKENQLVNIETAPLVSPLERNKRQQPDDATTAYVGLSILKGAGPADYAQVKQTARRVRRTAPRRRRSLHIGSRRRRKRPSHKKVLLKTPEPSVQIYHIQPLILPATKPAEHHHHHHHHKVYVPVPVTPAPIISAPPQILTETQATFDVINQNPRLSRNLREEFLREINATVLAESGGIDPARVQAVSRLVVVRETGITCVDVCGKSQGETVGYGTIGICTPKFCRCDFNFGTYTRMDCPADMVFDPISLSCNSPFNVVLCNDEEYKQPEHVKLIQPVLVVPKYILTTPVVTPVTPLSPPASSVPYLLANSLEDPGVLTVASPTHTTFTAVAPEATYPVRPASPSSSTFSATLARIYDSPKNAPQATYTESPAPFPFRTISTTFRPVTHYRKIGSTTLTSSSQFIAGQQNEISQLAANEIPTLNKFVAEEALPFNKYSNRRASYSSQLNIQQNPEIHESAYSTQDLTRTRGYY